MANEGTVSMLKAKTGESYAYSHAHSEMIRNIMKHKEAKQKEIEDTDYYKSDLNRDLLDEADQEEALGGPVSADANPLSLLANANGASAGGPFQIPGYASYGTALPSMSVGPVGGTHVFGDGLNTGLSLGKTPTAIVNGKPVYSDDPSDPFGGVLQNKAAPMYGRSAAPIGTAGPFGSSALVGSAAPFGSAAPVAIPYGTTRVPNTYGSAMPYSYGSAAPYGRSAAPYDGRSAAPYGSARPDSSKPIYPKGMAGSAAPMRVGQNGNVLR